MLPGQEYQVVIEGLTYQGEGICRVDGRVVFVPFVLPEEKVKIEIDSVKKNHAFASPVEVFLRSQDRVSPKCEVFTTCGGCSCQHLPYERQKDIKRQGIESNLRKIAGIDLTVNPVCGMDEPWHYRNKTTWQVMKDNKEYKAGFYESSSHKVVPTRHCPIASDSANRAMSLILGFLNAQPDLDFSVNQIVTRNNYIGELMLLFVCESINQPILSKLSEYLQIIIPELVSVCAHTTYSKGQDLVCFYGMDVINEEIDRLDFPLSPLSFFQVNHDIMNKMYTYAINQAKQDKNDVLVDIYSGIGTISMLAARLFKRVIGLELNPTAVQDAKEGAKRNKLSNTTFVAGFAEKELPKLTADSLRPDVIILDPPRKGADIKVLSAILESKPDKVVYISCHPASQARDTAILAEGGYEATACQPFDMFPQTSEIENVMTFVRRKQ